MGQGVAGCAGLASFHGAISCSIGRVGTAKSKITRSRGVLNWSRLQQD
jgi:hypothetical protein